MLPQDFDSYRVPISKASGKESAYIIYVNREGRKKFMNEQSHRYCPRNHEDMAIMSAYWKHLTQVEKDYYKKIELGPHNSDENKAKRRHVQERKRRENAHRFADAVFETRQIHRQNVRFMQEEKLKERGPQFIPDKKKCWEATTLFEKDFIQYCKKRRGELCDVFRVKIESPDPANLQQLRSETFTMVGVSSCAATMIIDEKEKTEDMMTVPREISIVNFTLKDGITSVKTIHLDADPEIYCREFIEQEKIDNVEVTSEYLGLPKPTYEQDVEDVKLAWRMFKDAWGTRTPKTTEKARIFCEKKYFNIVSYTFSRLSYLSGMGEWAFYSDTIKRKMIPVEDFVLMIKDAASSPLSDEETLQKYIKKNYVPKINSYHYCGIHLHQKDDDLKCQQARCAMAIHSLFMFLHKENFLGINQVYQEKFHDLCKERDQEIPDPTSGNIFIDYNNVTRVNRFEDFALVPSVTEKDPVPDTYHMSQFQRAFEKKKGQRKAKFADEEEEEDDGAMPNEDEGGVDDGEDDSDDDARMFSRPFNTNGFNGMGTSFGSNGQQANGQNNFGSALNNGFSADQNSSSQHTFGSASNNGITPGQHSFSQRSFGSAPNNGQSFNQNNGPTTSRPNIPSPHKQHQENWVDPSRYSRPSSAVNDGSSRGQIAVKSEAESSGAFRPESRGFRNVSPPQASSSNGPSSAAFQAQNSGNFRSSTSLGNFQNVPSQSRLGFANQTGPSQRLGFASAAPPAAPRPSFPLGRFIKPRNELTPYIDHNYRPEPYWRPYNGDLKSERLYCPEKIIYPHDY